MPEGNELIARAIARGHLRLLQANLRWAQMMLPSDERAQRLTEIELALYEYRDDL